MNRLSNIIIVALFTVFISPFLVAPNIAASDKTFRLNYASTYSSTQPHSIVDQKWIAKIENESKGRVKIRPYFGGTLISGREAIRELTKGSADIAHILPFYEKAGMDLIKGVMGFFHGARDPKMIFDIYRKVWDEFPEIRKELESIKVLTIGVGTPFYFLTKKPIHTLNDMKGLIIKGGPEHKDVFKQLGVEPDMTPMAEVYIALQKGIIDGTVCPLETLKTMRLAEVAGYFTLIPSARGAYPSKAFNWDSWKKLPPDIQKIFEDNGDWHGLKIVEEFIKKDEEGLAFAKEQGVEFIKPLKSEVDKWVEMMNVNSIKVSKELDAKGLPGTKIFNRIHQLINE